MRQVYDFGTLLCIKLLHVCTDGIKVSSNDCGLGELASFYWRQVGRKAWGCIVQPVRTSIRTDACLRCITNQCACYCSVEDSPANALKA